MKRSQARTETRVRALQAARRSLCLSLGLGLVLAGSAAAQATQQIAPMRLAVSMTPLSLPIFVADKLQYFAAEGLQLRLHEVVGGHRAMQQLLDGHADLATASEAVVVFSSFKSTRYAVLASFVSSSQDSKLVLRANAGIKQAQDLRGKRIGTVLGTASHYLLDSLLLANGVDPKDVQLIGLQPEAMADLLRSGGVDAVAIWEPIPFKILRSVPGSRVLPSPNKHRLSFNLLASKAMLGQRDAELQQLLRALERAERFIASKPSEAQAMLRERLKLDQSFIDWIWPIYNYRLRLDQSLLSTMEAQARWVVQEGHAPGERPRDYLDLIYSKPLRLAVPGAVGLIE